MFGAIMAAVRPKGAGKALTQTILTLQPDGTAGLDAYLDAGNATSNLGTATVLAIGQFSGVKYRGVIKFDLSSIPAGATLLAAVLSLYATAQFENQNSTLAVYRLKRAWVEAEATWNIYSTGNNWQTAGAGGANDVEATDIGTLLMATPIAASEFKNITLTAAAVQEMITGGAFTNNGFLVKGTEANETQVNFASSDNATAGNRPKLVVTYLS